MKVLVKTPRDFCLTFNDEDFEGLTGSEINEKITNSINEIVENQIRWTEMKDYIAF